MSEFSGGPPADPDEPDLRALVDGAPVPGPPPVDAVRRRVRRRSMRRRATGAVAALALLASAGVVAANRDTGGGEREVFAGTDEQSTIPPDETSTSETSTSEASGAPPWQWVDDLDMTARDGSPTGYLLRTGADTTRLLIHLADGDLCLAPEAACTREGFGDDAATAFVEGTSPRGALFDVVENNPFATWTAVEIPSTTADLHAGLNDETPLTGARNLELVLADLATRFPAGFGQVAFVGTGAGGLGSMINYPTVAAAFAPTAVDLLVDSAIIPLTTDLLGACLVSRLARALDRTYPDDWEAVVTEPQDQALAGSYQYLADQHPDARFGVIVTEGNERLRTALGRSLDDCQADEPLSEAEFAAGTTAVMAHAERFGWETLVLPGTTATLLDADYLDADYPDADYPDTDPVDTDSETAVALLAFLQEFTNR